MSQNEFMCDVKQVKKKTRTVLLPELSKSKIWLNTVFSISFLQIVIISRVLCSQCVSSHPPGRAPSEVEAPRELPSLPLIDCNIIV